MNKKYNCWNGDLYVEKFEENDFYQEELKL